MKLLDTTLREGEQRYGVYFSLEIRQRIACFLMELGIEEIEIGVVREDEELKALWETLLKRGFLGKLSLWCRLREEDLLLAESFPEAKLNLSVPVSPLHLRKRLRLSKVKLLKRIETLVSQAASRFSYVSLGLEDTSRAEEDFLFRVIEVAVQAGAKRIRLSDTLGLLNPLETEALIKKIKTAFPQTELSFHAHNDFGLATGNAIAALEAGANWVDVSLLGLGERAGIAPLEEVLAYLYFRRGKRHYRLEKLSPACHFVAWHAGTSLSEFKPILGRKLFYCETGLHVEGLYKAKELYEPFPPEALGLKRKFGIGAKSGRAAIKAKLREYGLRLTEPSLDIIVKHLKRLSREKGRPLTDPEIRRVAQKYLFLGKVSPKGSYKFDPFEDLIFTKKSNA